MKSKLIILIMTGVAIMLLNHTCTSAISTSDTALFERIEKSPQYKDGKFAGADGTLNMSISDYASTTWEYLFNAKDGTPGKSLPVSPVDLSYFNNPGNDQLNVTWLGHSSLMINIDGYKILADPVFEKRVSFFGPTRFNGDVPLDTIKLSDLDAVIISHDHYDHLNKFSVQQLNEKTKKFIVPLAVGERLVRWGVPREKIVELDWWEEVQLEGNLMVAATPAQHFSGRGLTDRNKTLWVSWVITGPKHNVFFGGDSGYFDGFKKIGEKYGPFEMTFIECGAYDTHWHEVHLYPEETVQAHKDLKGKVLHPIHWATFNLALHPWYEPLERLTAAAESAAVKAVTPVVGETTVFGEPLSTAKWWRKAMIHDGG